MSKNLLLESYDDSENDESSSDDVSEIISLKKESSFEEILSNLSDAKKISKTKQTLTWQKNLGLSGMSISYKKAQKLAKVFSKVNFIEKVNLEGLSIGYKTNLLGKSNLKSDGLCSILKSIFKNNKIKEINLKNCNIDLNLFIKITNLIQNYSDKIQVDLSNNNIKNDKEGKFFKILEKLPDNIKLKFSSNPCEKDLLVKRLLKANESYDSSNNSKLDMNNQYIGDGKLIKISRDIINLNYDTPYRTINLSNNHFNYDDIKVLTIILHVITENYYEILNTPQIMEADKNISKQFLTLRTLFLHNNNIRDPHLKHLLNGLNSQKSPLEDLILSKNQISLWPDSKYTFYLKNHLKELYLSDNQIGLNGIKNLAKYLYVNNSLEKLYLHNNKIDHNGAFELVFALKLNNTLTTLGLGGNQLGDTGAGYFAILIKENTPLKNLLLQNNKFGDQGLKYIINAMDSNSNLTTINLQMNYFSKSVLEKFQLYMNRKNIIFDALEKILLDYSKKEFLKEKNIIVENIKLLKSGVIKTQKDNKSNELSNKLSLVDAFKVCKKSLDYILKTVLETFRELKFDLNGNKETAKLQILHKFPKLNIELLGLPKKLKGIVSKQYDAQLELLELYKCTEHVTNISSFKELTGLFNNVFSVFAKYSSKSISGDNIKKVIEKYILLNLLLDTKIQTILSDLNGYDLPLDHKTKQILFTLKSTLLDKIKDSVKNLKIKGIKELENIDNNFNEDTILKYYKNIQEIIKISNTENNKKIYADLYKELGNFYNRKFSKKYNEIIKKKELLVKLKDNLKSDQKALEEKIKNSKTSSNNGILKQIINKFSEKVDSYSPLKINKDLLKLTNENIKENQANIEKLESEYSANKKNVVDAFNYYIKSLKYIKDPNIYYNIGDMFFKIELYKESIQYFMVSNNINKIEECFVKMFSSNKKNIELLEFAGDVYAKIKKYDTASKYYEKCFKLSFGFTKRKSLEKKKTYCDEMLNQPCPSDEYSSDNSSNLEVVNLDTIGEINYEIFNDNI